MLSIILNVAFILAAAFGVVCLGIILVHGVSSPYNRAKIGYYLFHVLCAWWWPWRARTAMTLAAERIGRDTDLEKASVYPTEIRRDIAAKDGRSSIRLDIAPLRLSYRAYTVKKFSVWERYCLLGAFIKLTHAKKTEAKSKASKEINEALVRDMGMIK